MCVRKPAHGNQFHNTTSSLPGRRHSPSPNDQFAALWHAGDVCHPPGPLTDGLVLKG